MLRLGQLYGAQQQPYTNLDTLLAAVGGVPYSTNSGQQQLQQRGRAHQSGADEHHHGLLWALISKLLGSI